MVRLRGVLSGSTAVAENHCLDRHNLIKPLKNADEYGQSFPLICVALLVGSRWRVLHWGDDLIGADHLIGDVERK